MKLRLTAVILLSLACHRHLLTEGNVAIGGTFARTTGGTGDEGTRFADACK